MKNLLIRCTAVTVFVFFVLFILGKITSIKLFTAFDPISTALGEFELTDYVFSKFRVRPNPDSRIVLVNLGPSRAAIAQQIQIISQHKPKVIGIDSFFNCEGGLYDTANCPQLLDTLGNLMLSNAITEAGNVVLVSRLLQSDSAYKTRTIDLYDSIEYSDPMFSDHAFNAFANLVTKATYQEDVKICKSFIPRFSVKNESKLAFAVQMAMIYDSAKTKRFLERNNEEEVINFIGNLEFSDVKVKALRESMDSTSEFHSLCYAIDWVPFAKGEYDPDMFKNSVVILGSLGDYFGDPAWEDKFFTPLNIKVAGRANPDMFGVVIHANIVAMILNEDYVNQLATWQTVLIAIVVCFLNVMLFTWFDDRYPVLFDGFSVVIQVLEIIMVSLIVIGFFIKFNLKMDLTLSIGILALVGPCFDIYKSFEKTFLKRFTQPHEDVLMTKNA
jgi:CHASE2 domain-containing sensor protein